MSVKHVKRYFNDICDLYHELLENVKDMQEAAEQGLISPERFEEYKKTIEPVKTNYERWSYMMYLLNKPNKKEKQKTYKKSRKEEIAEFEMMRLDKIAIEESKEALENANNFIKNIK